MTHLAELLSAPRRWRDGFATGSVSGPLCELDSVAGKMLGNGWAANLR
jgi:hypothetical protein